MKREKVAGVLLPVAFGILVIALWELGALHAVMGLRSFQLPVPSQILTAFAENLYAINVNGLYTLTEALVGLAIGSFFGFSAAVLATLFPKWGYFGLTMISALNSIPIIALSPIMNNWFGMGVGSKIAVVTIAAIAPMAINA
ncbi:MAG: ABC transporter permease, partial [Oscillospiraceae bacterium]|nr:ABC transporter permease [Oscillospiraceae bacterium]